MSDTKSLADEMLAIGTYRHYKGGLYQVYGVARHSETEALLVVYRPLYGERGLWVRPLEMFREWVNVDGRNMLRFEHVSEDLEGNL